MKLAVALLLSVFLPALANAQDQAPLTGKDVVQRMTDPQLQRYFPEAALRGDIHGSASVLCSITAEGALADCAPATEEPVGKGFGAAASKIATFVRIAPLAKDGSQTAGRKYLFVMKFGVH
jgi:protein TonB